MWLPFCVKNDGLNHMTFAEVKITIGSVSNMENSLPFAICEHTRKIVDCYVHVAFKILSQTFVDLFQIAHGHRCGLWRKSRKRIMLYTHNYHSRTFCNICNKWRLKRYVWM